jgi:hypothetical protein
MRLTYEQFKQKISETKAVIKRAMTAAAPKTAGKVSSTQKKRWRRARRTAPRAACDSFRYRQKHQWELRAKRRSLKSAL